MGKNGGICDLTTVDVGGKQKGEYGERFVAVDGHSKTGQNNLLSLVHFQSLCLCPRALHCIPVPNISTSTPSFGFQYTLRLT
jgi:hypothetical protein